MRPRSAAIFLLAGTVSLPASGQSLTHVGEFIQTPSHPLSAELIPLLSPLTKDGTWIAFVEGSSNICNKYSFGLSMMRTDGTDYRVVVPQSDLKALEPVPSVGDALRTVITRR